MLRSLAIRDFTIIDALELEFAPGFCAITGETGAGKSILIDALSQLLGDRADTSLVADGAKQADLTAAFEIPERHPARDWLDDQALQAESMVLLRRVIPADGASRAWIDGQPVTIAQLRQLGALLVEIHGQHEHQRLMDPARQREWLDRQVDETVVRTVADAASAYTSSKRALEELEAEAGSGADRELLEFQLEELDRLALAEGDFPELEADQRRLASVEELQRACAEALAALDGDEPPGALALTHRAARRLEALADRAPEFDEIVAMIVTARVNLEEAGRELQQVGEGLENDPERLADVERRLTRATELARKHRVEPEELPAFHARLRERVERLDSFGEELEAARRRVADALETWGEAAQDLNRARRQAGEALAGRIRDALAELGMREAEIEFGIEHDPDAGVSRHGADRVEILFSANPGRSPKPLRRIASGGELSRLSLAMIIAAAEPADGVVRIFDEIDAGVGGETAHSVGRFLRQAGTNDQAFCVTHLAQVAARADHQMRVVKNAGKGATRVAVEPLAGDARIEELARMLGSARSDTSRRHAAAMLEDA
ncbi:MAG: DNA repair protein RecN [Wenzhouxiangellaceae bacterium]|nr:DNA repair protein RecN [Wenzhouxiangellaceae bacterium]